MDGNIICENNCYDTNYTFEKGRHTIEIAYLNGIEFFHWAKIYVSFVDIYEYYSKKETQHALQKFLTSSTKLWYLALYEPINPTEDVHLELQDSQEPTVLFISSYRAVHFVIHNVKKANLKAIISSGESGHIPPSPLVLQNHFEKFVAFINHEHKEQYQLLMVAIAHHRFEYIHPFDNGNGRMGRLLNYAFLIKLGFKVKTGRIINPSSVFYTNRDKYYDMLSVADSLKDDDILAWCEYFLLGLKNEIEKIDSLLDVEYVKSKILLPTLKYALDREHITNQEYKILQYLINKKDLSMKAEELSFLGVENSKEKSKIMGKLKDKNIIMPTTPNGRIYTLKFVNNYLLRGVMKVLEQNGFVSDFLNSGMDSLK